VRHLNEARRFFGELALPLNLANAARLDSWLLDYCQRERVSIVPTRKVQQFGPSGLRDKTAIEAAVRELDDLGRARLVQDGRRRDIRINPTLLDGRAA
jgi:putative DNA primase/helicase